MPLGPQHASGPQGTSGAAPLPLAGVSVVTLEQAVAAPFATRQLADLGARVIKLERRGTGDFGRHYDRTVNGLSAIWFWLNRSKESVTLDVKHEAARPVLERLLERADVFVQNLVPGATERIGLGTKDLARDHPRLVVCNISGYGSTGPYRDRKAYDLLIQAEAGVMSLTGTADEQAKAGISIADIAGGSYAFSGILAALLERERFGTVRSVDVSLFDALSEWVSYPLYFSTYGGRQPERQASRHPNIAPYGLFSCADGVRLMIAVQNDREWVRMCQSVLDAPELAMDERFATDPARVTHREETDAVVGAWTALHDHVAAMAALDAAGIACSQLNDMFGLARHPQLVERGRWREVGSPVGPLRALRPPGIPGGAKERFDPPPELGEHTDDVLAWLGYSSAEIEELRADGAI